MNRSNGMANRLRATVVSCLLIATLISCAAPRLTFYVLAPNAPPSRSHMLNPQTVVVEVTRLALPDYLDTQAIVVRRGAALEYRTTARWASGLSLAATDLVTDRLSQRLPRALVTDQPQSVPPSYRILINVSRLDVATEGVASLEADWLIVSHDPKVMTARDRGDFQAIGPVVTDADVVALERKVLDQLSAAIDITYLQ